MSEPRFITSDILGYPINLTTGKCASTPALTVYVQDTLYNYKVVATFENAPLRIGVKRDVLRARAEREAARLNEWWRAELLRG